MTKIKEDWKYGYNLNNEEFKKNDRDRFIANMKKGRCELCFLC